MVGGVADYTTILSRRLVEVFGGDMELVLVHAGNQPAEAIDVDFPVEDLSGQCSASALAQAIERLAAEADGQAVVLLEYSGYGYAMRGAPLWLVRGLRRVCRPDGLPLFTVFHEVYTSGPLWSSAFWVSPLQRWIAGRLARHSTHALVNRVSGREQLRRWTTDPSTVSLRPVFSNVGEPDARRPISDRERTAVLFVGEGEKDKLYRDHSSELRQLFGRLEISRAVDIGPRPPEQPDLGVDVDIKGMLPADEVSHRLERAQIGLAYRRLDMLAKSGVVAAYLAHGVVPVIMSNGGRSEDAMLSHGTQYVTLNRTCSSSVECENLSRRGFNWYSENAHSCVTARTVSQYVRSASRKTKAE
jgi:hypothetical protein